MSWENEKGITKQIIIGKRIIGGGKMPDTLPIEVEELINNLKAENKQLRAEMDKWNLSTKNIEEDLTFEAEAKQLQAEVEKHRWIPVSERLPEDDKPCLILLISGNIIQGIPSCDLFGPDGILWRSVTHWKPIVLPEQALQK